MYLFDEPLTFLDIKQRINVAMLIKSLKTNSNQIIVVEHDLAILDFLADYTCLLYGVSGAYGVLSTSLSVKDGINNFINGFIPEDNVRF